jgi:protein required for attachment to host cells
MTMTWILVANASSAKFFANNGPNKGLTLVKELDHPASRDKNLDLASDRPGHNQGHGNGRGSFVPATQPKENEAGRFAQVLARELDEGRTRGSYNRLIVVASNPFFGTLKGHLSNPVRGMVSDSIEKDYTRVPERDLAGRLEHCIYL